MATFILCHGGWAGGWQWDTIPARLRAQGHTVFTPTFTGMGERLHLAHPEINLDTHITDIVNVVRFEELDAVTLVGYSYSGMVITGVADQIPERIAQLVYLDAFVPADGQALVDLLGDEVMQQVLAVTAQVGEGWKVPFIPEPDKPFDPRLLIHPVRSALQPVAWRNPAALALPRTYIYCPEDKATMRMGQPLIQAAQRARSNPDWHYYELPTDHNPIRNLPEQLAALLMQIATQHNPVPKE